jgi:hypothetical protein
MGPIHKYVRPLPKRALPLHIDLATGAVHRVAVIAKACALRLSHTG